MSNNSNIRFCRIWWWCITLRITRFPDFVHRLVFYNLENTMFQKLDLFPSSGNGRKTHTLLGPSESANLNHWTTMGQSSHVKTETDPFSKMLHSVDFRILDNGHVQKPSDSK
jgi:hypothetical protein